MFFLKTALIGKGYLFPRLAITKYRDPCSTLGISVTSSHCLYYLSNENDIYVYIHIYSTCIHACTCVCTRMCIYAHTRLSCFLTKLCPTLCDPMDCSLPGFSIHGIFQARILEWVAISFSNTQTYSWNNLCNHRFDMWIIFQMYIQLTVKLLGVTVQ